VVIAVTEDDDVFALDATDGSVIWGTNLGPSVAATSLPCGNLSPYGITGTPVVDLASRALFLDAFVTDPVSASAKHFIYSINVDTGAVNPGWPVDVDVAATNGSTQFNSYTQGQRGALAVIGSNVYVPYGGLWGDCSNYNGWVVGVPLNNPANVIAWATTANRGGAWGVGGIASDGTDPFIATGNTVGASTWGSGEAIIHLTPGLALTGGALNYWAPTNWSALDQSDLDIGGCGPLLVNVLGATPSNLVVAFGKDQNVYLVDRDYLGGISPPVNQATVGANPLIQAAATYRTTVGTYVVFADSGYLKALLIGATSPPTITNAWTAAENGFGSPFVTSTDGTNNVVVWGIGSDMGGDQRLHGFDGDTGATVFNGGGSNELMAGTRRFNTGIVARGRIFVANDNQVYAFNLPAPTIAPFTLTNLTLLTNGAFQFSFTNVPSASFSVFATTNLADSFVNWVLLGGATEVSPGQYQFTDTELPVNSARFYIVNTP
jgi:hypothetical protein